MVTFHNRSTELALLSSWFETSNSSIAVVWGRRRVGKTALVQQFAGTRRAVFHTAVGTDRSIELQRLGEEVARVSGRPSPDFRDWRDACRSLGDLATDEPLLVVIDEYPSLRDSDPTIDAEIRAAFDALRSKSKVKLILCGSAVRTMHAIQQERSPLYGRFDLSLLVEPMKPHEASLFLRGLDAEDKARVWGLVGGMPLYLTWWDASASLGQNLTTLAGRSGAPLLSEGELVLATDGLAEGLARQILMAIANGRTRVNEISQSVTTVGERSIVKGLDDLERLRLIERVVPVTDDRTAPSGRTSYRIADNFLAFWLTFLAPARGQIERGLGVAALKVVRSGLDDWMGIRWEDAVRTHVIRLINEERIDLPGKDVAAVGSWWNRKKTPVELDIVVLDLSGAAVLIGEAKWARSIDGPKHLRELQAKASELPNLHPDAKFLLAARNAVTQPRDALVVTAADVFG